MNEKILGGNQYSQAAEHGWAARIANIDDEGRLGCVQQVGDRPEDVRPDDYQLYGPGTFLLAAGQMLQFNQD